MWGLAGLTVQAPQVWAGDKNPASPVAWTSLNGTRGLGFWTTHMCRCSLEASVPASRDLTPELYHCIRPEWTFQRGRVWRLRPYSPDYMELQKRHLRVAGLACSWVHVAEFSLRCGFFKTFSSSSLLLFYSFTDIHIPPIFSREVHEFCKYTVLRLLYLF